MRSVLLTMTVLVFGFALAIPGRASEQSLPPLEWGIDRSNMGTEWTISPPGEPNIFPFNGPYNGPGVFEARRNAVFDGIARTHAQWFRDGFGADTPKDTALFVDTVKQVHARGMKILAVVGPGGGDYDPKDYIDAASSGCRWGTHPLSKINLAKFEQRLRSHLEAVKNAGETVDAFEVGNEMDLYCNDADMPKAGEFARHHWTWFLTDDQVRAFAAGYAPFLATFAKTVRQYFPTAKIITCGMSNPSGNSAALIAALANFPDSSGKPFDYTSLVDGYGTHIYLGSTTTLSAITHTTQDLTAQAALLPHLRRKPIWITEWNEAGAAFWSSHKWYFQPTLRNGVMLDLNKADTSGRYPPMTRAEVILAFERDVIGRLRTRPDPINIGYLLYYSYDQAGKSDMCDGTVFNTSRGIKGACFGDVVDPVSGNLQTDIASALAAATTLGAVYAPSSPSPIETTPRR